MNKKIALVGIIILGIASFAAAVFFFLAKNKGSGNNPLPVSSSQSPTPTVQSTPTTDFNTKPTKLIDLSPYDLEKSKKLWSEASYFLFDGKGWLAQVPLMKKGEDKGVIVVGYGKGGTKELTDGYGSISPDGKFAVIEKIDRKIDGEKLISIQKKYLVKDIETDATILETPLFNDVQAIYFDKNSAFHIITQEQGNLIWYKDNVSIMKITVPVQSTPQETKSWVERSIFHDEDTLAMAGNINGSPQIMVNGKVITPEWKYSDDPILGIRILATLKDGKIFYACVGKKNLAFFANEKETIGDLLTDSSSYTFPFLMGDFSASAAISFDGKKLAIVDNSSNEPFVRVLGESPRVFRKAYPKGSRILKMSFSPDGKQLYYEVETDFNATPEERQAKIIVNENEQGPWKSTDEFQWSGNGSYAYVATDEKFNTIVIKNGKTERTIQSSEYHEDVFGMNQLGFNINPVDGRVFYILDNRKFVQSKVVYDEKEGPAYTGSITGVNWGKSFFSNDGKHLVYLITPPDTQNSDSTRLVIDGEIHTIEGTLLGSWGSKDGGFSDDGKWFGIYVMKENAVWWTPFNLERL